MINVFNMSASAASQQLKLLELSGLVSRERHGQMTCYQVKL
ncbi:winged helix-turn-helix transcriptional regulator [Patescibacteria group bacterium]|nr:winged helix-turn-helix transcriptional regulator [Patescibacteria group bacterium]